MKQQNFNQNELEQLLNPPKSKAPVIIGLVVAFLGILFMGSMGFVIYKAISSQEFQTAFQQGLQEGLQDGLQEGLQEEFDYEASNTEDEHLISITKEQASEWVHINEPALLALIEKIKAYPQMEKMWLASANELQNNNTYVWINDITCTATPGAVDTNNEDGVALFSDVLNKLNVPVTAFYDLNNEMQALNIVGVEIDASGEIDGINLYHGKYDGAFYYSLNSKQTGDYGEHLFDNWWYFP